MSRNVFSVKIFNWSSYEIKWVAFIKCSSYPSGKDSVPLSSTKINISKNDIPWKMDNIKLYNGYGQMPQRRAGK